ncbi:MAG: D-amino acid dehydrogenase [Rhodospirillales bacterium]|nr:D-amino acid dehydrogenase [Rhodospirillales bacterium]MBO6785516.1 D-amino acid dehydrogenase [Rhodospirillales bacterium]
MPDTAIIGAGVTGVLTAYNLARLGHDVSLFDRHDSAAMETSFANGGQISASNAEVWNTWHSVWTAASRLLSEDAPLRIGLRPDLHKLRWFCAFAREGLRHRANTIELAKMALHSRQCLRDVAAREGIDFDRRDSGLLHIYGTRAQFDAALRANTLLTGAGLERYPVTPAEIAKIEPALDGNYHAGLFTPGDFSGDIHKFTRGLLNVCTRLGVKIRFGRDVRGVSSDGRRATVTMGDGTADTYDNIVICAGVGSHRLARALGDDVNVYPVKGYSLTIEIDPATHEPDAPVTALLDEDAKIVTSRLGNRLRIAGLAEFRGADTAIDPARIAILHRWVARHFPRMGRGEITEWAGLRPMTPRMVPKVGRGRMANVYYNTGHGHLGWTLSAGTAETIAGMIAAGD